jgi:hypothetical protein
VDSAGGDDKQDGLAPAHAWRSFERANATTFAPGDRLLLRAGSVWDGVTLAPPGSGTPGQPIVLDRYGEGAMPALNGQGRVPCVLRLENQAGWEIANLEITNHAATEGQRLRGVELRAKDCGVLRHLHLKNLFIHDVNAASNYTNDGDTVAKSFGGLVTLIEGNLTPTAWDDLLVENCRFVDAGAVGLTMFSTWTAGHRTNDPATWFPSRSVVIRGNTFERIARNGLVVRACVAPLIERNLFRECGLLGSGNASFAFHCDDALFQFNEACLTKYNPGDADAAGFDSDYNCRRTVFQFNYSHDNDYGFILLCCNGAGGFNEGTIVRYNISQNDGGNVIRLAGPVKGSKIYNNTIYVGSGMQNPRPGEPLRIVYHKSWGGWSDDTAFFNNIIVNLSARAAYDPGQSTDNRYDHNLFFGTHPGTEPDDAHKLTADPRFAQPGGAAAGRETAARAYTLGSGSVAEWSGVTLAGHAGFDFAGHPVRAKEGRVDLGALTYGP